MTASARPPQPGVVRPYEFPATHRATLTNGVRVVVASMRRLPIVTVAALVDAGAVAEAAGQEGVASLAARTLTEGTGDLDGAAVVARLEGLGTAISAEAEWDSSVAQFTATANRLDSAFGLFAEIVRSPSFPERDVLRLRDERLAEISQQLAEPRGLADERFDGFVYASGARYSLAAAGTRAAVRRLGREAVQAFHGSAYVPQRTTLIFVGDITPERAMSLADRRFGSWRTSIRSPAIERRPDTAREDGRRAVVVSKADAPQSELRVGHVGVPRSHPDYLAIVVMNAILGGLFSSRINLNLRERHAFTYGASSAFDWRRGAGPFVVSTAVKSEVTERALAEILSEIDKMRNAPPTVAEVDLVTAYLAGVFPIRFESTAAVAAALARATVFSLPDDWFGRYRERIRAVTVDAVHLAARDHLGPERLLTVVVGDPAVIGAPLERAGVGRVTIIASDDDPTEEV